MKKMFPLIVLVILPFISCKKDLKSDRIEKWKSEIVQTEKEFAEMAAKEGIQAAFVAYAAEDVAILRNDSLLAGKEALREYYKYKNSGPDQVNVTWKPDFVDVASSGDLAYTYGKYLYTITDTLGKSRSYGGFFHTVWKRQTDGKWRFVWD
jgi:ketosteroid isomerase-like protein